MISATKYLKYVLSLTVIMLLSACSHPDSRLSDIDSYIESDPDSAYTALKAIDRASLSEEDFAYYALLYTQAQVKCHEILHSDSLLRHAYDRYSLRPDGDLKKRAHFYNCEIAFQNKDYPRAMRDALVAYEIAKSTDDHYWWAKSAERISDIFYEVYNYNQSLPFEFEAIDNYLKSQRIANHRYCICDLASIYFELNRDTDAFHLLDSLRRVVIREVPVDSSLLSYLDKNLLSALQTSGNIDVIEDNITNINQLLSKDDAQTTIMKSVYLSNRAHIDSAERLLTNALYTFPNGVDHAYIMYSLYKQHIASKNFEQAALMADSLLFFQGEIARDLLQESVACVQRDFYSYQVTAQRKKAKNTFYILLTVIAVAIVITVLLILIYKLKLHARNAEIEANASLLLSIREQAHSTLVKNRELKSLLDKKEIAVESLKKQLGDKNIHGRNTSAVIEHLFKEKWATLNMLCDEYFELNDCVHSRIAILNNIDKELKKMRSSKNLDLIENDVDNYMGGIMTIIRTECPFLKKDDFTFLSLVFAGFSVRAVCLFMGIKYKLYYLKKSRLLNRIQNSNAPHKEIFLNLLKT